MADLKDRLRAMFEEQEVPPGLREEVLSEVLLTDRSWPGRRLAWAGAAAIAAIVVVALLVARLAPLHPHSAPAGLPPPPRATPTGMASPPVPPPAATPIGMASPPVPPPAATPSGLASPPPGPSYTTLASAEAYVRAQSPFARFPPDFVDTDRTWRPSAKLEVVRATPFGGADYQGDYFYFFVDGTPVGSQLFDHARSEAAVADDTFAVTYAAYAPGDGHIPSGGSRTVRFHWDGARLVALDPLTGATQS